jgi:hypothetical protein
MQGQRQKGEGTFQLVQGLLDGFGTIGLVVLFDQMGEYFGVGRGLENRTLYFQVATDVTGVDDVSVVTQGEITGVMSEQEWLDIDDAATSTGGVADVSDGGIAPQARQVGLMEYIGDQSFAAVDKELLMIGSDDAAAFLPSVLECMEAVIRDFGGVFDMDGSKHAAFFLQFPLPG